MSKGEHLVKKDKSAGFAAANIIICGAVFAATTVCLFALERPTVSEIEKRKLTAFPEFSTEELFSGRYTDQISEFFNDTVPERDFFKQVASSIRGCMGIQLGGTTTYGSFETIGDETTAEITGTAAPENTTEPEISQDGGGAVTTVPDGTTAEETTTTKPRGEEIAPGVFVNGQIVVQLDGHYWGISMYVGGKGENYVSYLNSFRSNVGDDVNVYCMLAPTSSAFYTPSNFSQYNGSHIDSINAIYGALDDGITTVDAYHALEQHLDEDIYLRTDHHWQPLGAYYAAQEFAKQAGVPFETVDNMTPKTYDDFVGSIYSFTEDTNLLNDPEVFTYYVPQNDYKCYYYNTAYEFDNIYPFFIGMNRFTAYSTFMGSDDKIVRVETDVDNGRKLCVIKDSYGNAEIPFYMNSFEEIYVIDMRYFDLNIYDFVKEQGITDVLFTSCTFSAVGPNAEGILTIETN